MKQRIAFLLSSVLALTFFACEKPPERCNEEITVSPEAGKLALERLHQMADSNFFVFDFSKISDAEQKKIGLLLAATSVGEQTGGEHFNLAYLEQKAHKVKAMETLDKRFFFLYNTSQDRSFQIVQLEVEWRINQLTSNPEIFRVTKTGYFDAEGNLLCFWLRTPKVAP